MSRADHITKRWQATMGNHWWWRRYADLTDRRRSDGSYRPFDYERAISDYPNKKQRALALQLARAGGAWARKEPHRAVASTGEKPAVFPRPPGMSRQTHRRLYREACKIAGVPYK